MTDKAWVEDVDGEPVLVHGSGYWTDEDREMFASIVRSAKAKFFKEEQK